MFDFPNNLEISSLRSCTSFNILVLTVAPGYPKISAFTNLYVVVQDVSSLKRLSSLPSPNPQNYYIIERLGAVKVSTCWRKLHCDTGREGVYSR